MRKSAWDTFFGPADKDSSTGSSIDWLFDEGTAVDPVWEYRRDDRTISAAMLAWLAVLLLLALLAILVYFPRVPFPSAACNV
eukprot:m.441050 g.441050  ORF g.441050 m.441050 type:complete len:82 (-) comp18609_c0_seq1:1508-1753(-)